MKFSRFDPPTSERVAPNKPPDGRRGAAPCEYAGPTPARARLAATITKRATMICKVLELLSER
jgi:hypothetical protein